MKLSILLITPLVALISCTTDSQTNSADITNPVLKDSKYPSAFPVKGDRNKVISPYRPYNIINIKGLKPGHFARDISTAKKDANGKAITSSAKIFLIPMPSATAQ